MRVSPLILPSKNPPKFTDFPCPSAPAVLAAPAPTLKIGWNVWSDCLTFWGIKHDKQPSTTINHKTYKIPIKSLWPNQVGVESTSQLGGYVSENTEAWPFFLHCAATWGMCYKPDKPSSSCFKSYPTEEKCQIDSEEMLSPIPSSKLSHNYGKSPCYSWENSLFLWWFCDVP